MGIKKIKLKGGSLSKTSLVIDGSDKYVLKEISLNQNREYGFQRWYSQLKKLQRFEVMFPGLFPKLLDFGYSNEYAYFKIEYIENSKNGYEFLSQETNHQKIEIFLKNIFNQLNKIHKTKISYFPNSLELYFEEELTSKGWKSYQAMKTSAALRETLWSMVSEIFSDLDHDFSTYTQKTLSTYHSAWNNFIQT